MGIEQLEYIARILLAGICGMLVGIERKNRSKEAGTRTHFVVACGAALMMVISKYAFFDVVQSGAYGNVDVRLDPSRIASTIASGIGFLGAGMIFVYRKTIIGLTTAAGIWATSGIGMAIGAGMYVVGVSVTFIIILAQIVLHINFHHSENTKTVRLTIFDVEEDGYQKYMTEEFDKRSIHIQDVCVDFGNEDGKREYIFTLDMPRLVNEEEILNFAKYRSKIEPLL